jgi:phosphatidylserine decarboxylase
VAGVVTERRVVDGAFHACNPSAVVVEVTPFSKNRRVVTVIDSDVDGGTQVGQVVLVEVVALMVGEVVSCASHHHYDAPRPLEVGHWVTRGAPLSLFRPGSSSVVVGFEPGRVTVDADLLAHQRRRDVESRFSRGFGEALVETEVHVRQSLGRCSHHAA